MGEHKAVLKKHRNEITEAQLVVQTPQHHEQDDISRKLKLVVGRAGALIELALARGTPKDAIAKPGSLRQPGRCRNGTGRAMHAVLLVS
jgi:hypothetical protein